MVIRYIRCALALSLASLAWMLSACQSGDKPGPAVTGSGSPSPTAQVEPAPTYQDSEPPSQPDTDTFPSPSQSGSPSPSQSGSPSPSQSGSPSPSQSAFVPSAPVGAVPEGEDVGSDWFADAVFLGDSRTDGLRLYSGIKGATFICHTGLTVFTIGKNACIKAEDGSKITAMDALAKQQYAKVYLMLGVNELGYTTTSFLKSYTELVEQIKELQPGAAIYLQTLIPINEPIAYQNGTNRAINNEKLKEFNQVISAVAQTEGVGLVDVDVPFWSEDGCLAAENTGDGVHLTRSGYQAWYAYLRTHTGSGEAAPAPSAPPAVEGWEVPEYTAGQDPNSVSAPPAPPPM